MFPDLMSHNPASHLVWWVAAGLFGMLVLFALVELLDWLHDRLHDRLHPGPKDEDEPADWALRAPDDPVRRRYVHRLAPFLGNVRDHRPNAPPGDR